MARVFISHSSRDREQAGRLHDWLRNHGFVEAFLDFDKHAGIAPGSDWERTLYREIAGSEAVILVLTANWFESKWCFAEFTQARALGKAIFPLIESPRGEDFVSPDIQHINLIEDREQGLDRLSSEVVRIALNARGGFPWERTRPPFPGLLAFDEADAAIYFGRDEEVRRLIERLNARRAQGGAKLVALLGASGAGKSSLMRAGVLPRLKRDRRNWIVLPPFRPQISPFDELAQAAAGVLGADSDWRQWRDALAGENPRKALSDFARDVRAKYGANEAQILIPIDQGEELFGTADKAEAERCLRVLNAALDERLPFIVLLALRSDYLGQLQQAPGLESPFEEFSLKPMPLERVRDIIEGPARVAGLAVDNALVDAAMKDAATDDALPLLAFALREIYDRFAASRRLTLAEYLVFGDTTAGISPLENAVRKRADEVLADARPTPEDLRALKEAFVPAMVRVNAEGEYVRRPALIDSLPARSRPLIERLAKARLLVVRQDGATAVVEVAHEALLRKWPQLRGWLDEEREFLIGKEQLEQDLRDWQKARDEEKVQALLTGLKLSRARSWLIEKPHQLSEAERHFIQASIQRQDSEARQRERLRRYVQIGTMTAALVLAMVAGVTVWQWNLATVALTQMERTHTIAVEAVARNVAVVEGLANSPGITKRAAEQILNVLRDTFGKLLSGREQADASRAQVHLFEALASAYLSLGNMQNALETALQGHAVADRMAKRAPDADEWQRALASSLRIIGLARRRSGDLAGALAAQQESGRLYKSLIDRFPQDHDLNRHFAYSLQLAGDIFRRQGKLDDALLIYRQSLDITGPLHAKQPSNTEWLWTLAVNHERLGDILRAQGDLEGALRDYESYRARFTELLQMKKSATDWQRELVMSNEKVGDVLLALGERERALQRYEEGQKGALELVETDRSNALWRTDLAFSYQKIGHVRLAQDDAQKALEHYRRYLAIVLDLVKRDDGNTNHKRDESIGYAFIGDALMALGKHEEALGQYQLFRSIAEQLYARDNSNNAWQRHVALGHQRTGEALLALQRLAEALQAFRLCLAVRITAATVPMIAEPKDVGDHCRAQASRVEQQLSSRP